MVESADRLLRILESFGARERDVSLADLADRVALPKSSVHRLLTTLVAHGFVDRDPATRRYTLGIRLFELGSAAIHERGLHGAAQPQLEELSRATGETCHLAVLSGTEAVYVYKVDGPSDISMSSRVGGRAPCHATSIGKVLIAWAAPEQVAAVRAHPMAAITANTITSPARFDAELALVRAQGYALDLEEYAEGLHCISAPVRDQMGRVSAALGIAGPRTRIDGDRLVALIPMVVAAAHQLSRQLGFVEDHSLAAVT
ncbi:MAG: IclR family transcriptional regulator [Candidatus Dormibacteria bacterium]|jgi:DNA-binding IclR family transcriptional regulator